MAQPRYLSAAEFFVLAWPRVIRADDFEPGRISPLTKVAGAGTGTLTIGGHPRDAFSLRIECVVGGEPGAAKFRYYTDGANWGDTEIWPADSLIPLVNTIPMGTDAGDLLHDSLTGLDVTVTAGVAPSFVAGAAWTLTTRESAQIRTAITAGSARVRRLFKARYDLAAAAALADASVKQDIAVLCRRALLTIRGVDPGQDKEVYEREEKAALAALIEVASKLQHPDGLVEGPVYSPDVYEGGDRYGISAAHRAKGGARG